MTAVMREYFAARNNLAIAEQKQQMASKELKVIVANKRSEVSR